MHYITSMKSFDTLIMLVICGSSIALATEDPVDENSPRNIVLNYLDYGFTAVFTCEMLLKVNALHNISELFFKTEPYTLVFKTEP